MNLAIDRGLPVPGKQAKGAFRTALEEALPTMVVGDSVFVPGAKIGQVSHIALDCSGPIVPRFTCRTRVECGVDGVRIWRIK